jgi:hypothetical protein
MYRETGIMSLITCKAVAITSGFDILHFHRLFLAILRYLKQMYTLLDKQFFSSSHGAGKTETFATGMLILSVFVDNTGSPTHST